MCDSLCGLDTPPPHTRVSLDRRLRGVGVSCAHFVLDSAIMLLYSEDFIKALRRPLYIQMMLHHIASVLVWPYALYRNKCCLAVAYYMCSECSNISLLVRWFVTECGIKGPLRMAADATFFITYTLIRFASASGALPDSHVVVVVVE